jgi:hypothetical protein
MVNLRSRERTKWQKKEVKGEILGKDREYGKK